MTVRKEIPHRLVVRNNVMKIAILSKAIYRFNEIFFKILRKFL